MSVDVDDLRRALFYSAIFVGLISIGFVAGYANGSSPKLSANIGLMYWIPLSISAVVLAYGLKKYSDGEVEG